MSGALMAGALIGAVMGLASQAYWLVILAYRPPSFITRQGPRTSLGSVILFAGLFAVFAWIGIGGLIGVVCESTRSAGADSVPFPTPAFTLLVLFLATFALIPAAVFLRAWIRHVLITYFLFIGLFGLLLPNLVVAVQG